MPGKRAAGVRGGAAGLALWVALAASLPVSLTAPAPGAWAAETPNPWKLWIEDLADRENKVEVPFLVLVSIAPMIAITPIWLGQLALAAARGED